jgi:hypothetical protein
MKSFVHRMRRLRSALVVAAAVAVAAPVFHAPAAAQAVAGLYYKEVEKDGRVYVFNTPERFKAWSASGEIGTAVTIIGGAEGGLTLVGENDTAVDLYVFKHNLPAYERPTPKPAAPAKYPSTKIQGRFYGNFTDKEIENKGTGAKSADSGVAVDVKRFYFTLTHEIDERWSAQFQSDIGDVGARRYDVFVKKAYVQGKFSDAVTLRLGAADSPWIPYVEGVYGLRYFEQTITDTLSFGTSADWGLHLLGKAAGGKVDYQFSIVNGKTYSRPDRSKTVDFEGRIAFMPVEGLRLAVGGYSGKRGNDLETNSTVKHTAERLNAFAGYSKPTFGVGVEFFQADNWNNVTTVAEDSADGVSVFAHFVPKKDWKVFARYDNANPSKDLNEKLELTYFNVGVERKLNAAFSAALALKQAEVEGGTISTGNGSIGSAVARKKGEYNEVGVWLVYNF